MPAKMPDPNKDLNLLLGAIGFTGRFVTDVAIKIKVNSFATATVTVVLPDGTVEKIAKILTSEGWQDKPKAKYEVDLVLADNLTVADLADEKPKTWRELPALA